MTRKTPHNLLLLCGLAVLGSSHCEAQYPQAIVKVVAQIVHKSPIPDPSKSDYPDCLYTAEAKVLEIQSDHRSPRELILALPAFTKRKLDPEAAFSEGHLIEAEIISQENADKALKTQQRSDTQERFDLQVFYSITARPSEKKVENMPPVPDSYFEGPKKIKATGPPARYPWSEKAAIDRKAAIEKDKETIKQALSQNGGKWDAWDTKLRPFYKDLSSQVKSSPGQVLIQGPFHFARIRYTHYSKLCEAAQAGKPGPLMMLSSLNRQLRARGIDLIVVPFPNKEDIHADVFSKLAPADGWFTPHRQQFLLKLLEADIETIDLTKPLQAARSRFPFIFYPQEDHHPADGGLQVAAEEIAKRLERYEFSKQPGFKPLNLSLEPFIFDKEDDGITVKFPATRVVNVDNHSPLEIPDNTGSPVVIMGDSFTLVPLSYSPAAAGAALPMHVAYRSGILPNYLSSKGSSDKAMHLLAREGGDYLAHRAVLIFAFAPNRLFGQDSGHDSESWNLVDLPPLPLGD